MNLIHESKMSGKLAGIWAINTNTLTINFVTIERQMLSVMSVILLVCCKVLGKIVSQRSKEIQMPYRNL